MEKYTRIAKRPCNVICHTPQADAYRAATIETNPEYFMEVKIAVVGDRVFNYYPKYITGVANTRTKGGKWEEVNYKIHRKTIAEYIDLIGAKPAQFAGGPRIKAA